MFKRLSAVAAFAAMASAALTAAPAAAQQRSEASTARVVYAAAPDSTRFIANDVPWNCKGTVCAARDTGSKPERVCTVLARRGQVVALRVGKVTLDDAAIARCNAK